MTSRRHENQPQLGRAAARVFAANDRMNQMLIEHLDPAAWLTKTPTKTPGKVRNIAAIFTHMHNARAKWIRLTAPHLKVPRQLNRSRCTPEQARAALGGGKRIRQFRRDGWARPWPAGVEMLCYMLAHEAHHRGQVCMLAHQLGFPLPEKVASGIWNWEKLWKECGAPRGKGDET